MSGATRPTGYPRWADTGATAFAAPPSGKMDVGWAVGEKPPAQFMNWLQNNYYQWIEWFDQNPGGGWLDPGIPYTEKNLAPSLAVEYQGVLDGGGFGPGIRAVAPSVSPTIINYALRLLMKPGNILSKVDVRGQHGATGKPMTFTLMKFQQYTGTTGSPTGISLANVSSASGVNRQFVVTLAPSGGVQIDSNTLLMVEVAAAQIGDVVYGLRPY